MKEKREKAFVSVSPEDTERDNGLEVDRPKENGNKSNKIKSFASFTLGQFSGYY